MCKKYCSLVKNTLKVNKFDIDNGEMSSFNITTVITDNNNHNITIIVIALLL